MLKIVIASTIVVLIQSQLASTKRRFVPNVPEECQRLGYCNQEQPDYPTKHIDELIEKMGLQNEISIVYNNLDDIESTRSKDPQEVDLCNYVTEKFIPKIAQDTNGTWHFIINRPRYEQLFFVEICKEFGGPCSPVAFFPNDYSASCQQDHIIKVLPAIGRNGKIIEKQVKIPSNCYCCVVKGKKMCGT